MSGDILDHIEAKNQICLALGLDPSKTTKVIIELDCGNIIQVHAVITPGSEQLKKVSELFQTNFTESARVDECHVVLTPGPPDKPKES